MFLVKIDVWLAQWFMLSTLNSAAHVWSLASALKIHVVSGHHDRQAGFLLLLWFLPRIGPQKHLSVWHHDRSLLYCNSLNISCCKIDSLDFVFSEDLAKMEYMSMCIKEGLRHYPPVSFIQREFTQDFELDGRTFPGEHGIHLLTSTCILWNKFNVRLSMSNQYTAYTFKYSLVKNKNHLEWEMWSSPWITNLLLVCIYVSFPIKQLFGAQLRMMKVELNDLWLMIVE